MAYARYSGGLGISPCGRTECGNAASVIEPRYLISVPPDQQQNVPVSTQIRFVTYAYSSWVDIADITVEISEDAGVNWVVAFDGENFITPYNGTNSRVLRDGHSLILYLQKIAQWPLNQKVMVRFTGFDEYGQSASKEAPIVW